MFPKPAASEATSDTSSHDSRMTPPTEAIEATVVSDLWDGRAYAVPWPGNKYIIYEKGTDRVITLTTRGLCLERESLMNPADDERTHWLCVERQGYFGFHNPKRGVYMGHDDRGNIIARATNHNDWEIMTPRRHPDGGYQLLLPKWWHTLTVLTVAEDGKTLANRPHGVTLWEFVKV